MPIADNAFANALESLADAIRLAHPETPIALVGIHSGGVPIARRLASKLAELDCEVGSLDIGLYRDDTNLASRIPNLVGSVVNFDVQERVCILVDDVLFTGRTIRAAMNQLADFGRPKAVELAVLVDRGHREIPIFARFVGLKLETSRREHVRVGIAEIDGADRIEVRDDHKNA